MRAGDVGELGAAGREGHAAEQPSVARIDRDEELGLLEPRSGVQELGGVRAVGRAVAVADEGFVGDGADGFEVGRNGAADDEVHGSSLPEARSQAAGRPSCSRSPGAGSCG
ncbi:hypothetical protein GCM10010495_20510 [Kitasatospora herbaricolor]|nr:hypothetical protein GCM10010495_20510 [Kitasatospora herbaricolor]